MKLGASRCLTLASSAVLIASGGSAVFAQGTAQRPSGPPRNPIAGTTWLPIGPAPIQGFFNGGVTGRASAIAVNEFNPDDIYVGGAAGGVWHSIDGGVNWLPLSDNEASLAIGALALDGCGGSGCATIYAGTGENAIRRDTYYGAGLLIGELVGEFFTWTLRTGAPFDFTLGSINDVILDPMSSGDSKRIYVTLSSGVTASATEATVTAPEPSPGGYGIYRSENRGLSWTKLSVPGADGFRPTDLEIDPFDCDTLYAGFLGRGIFKSTDRGQHWVSLNGGIPSLPPAFDHVEIAIYPGNSLILYTSLGMCPDHLLDGCIPSIYRSMDGGVTWERRLQGDPTRVLTAGCPRVYSRYTHVLTVHPTNPEVLFLGGVELCKSTDGGRTFLPADKNAAPGTATWKNESGQPQLHLDHHEVVIYPTNALRMYDTSDGGFAISCDGGETWMPRNDDLQITGFQSIASSPLTGRILGASQDQSAQLWMGNRGWEATICCGDGGFAVMDFDDSMKMYVGNNFGEPRRSTDGGKSWRTITTGIPPSDPRIFYAPIVQDPSSPHPLYFGTNRLFKSTNDGSQWTAVSPVLSTEPVPEIVTRAGQPINGAVDVITAIAVAPTDPGRIIIGYYSGKVFTTTNATTDPAAWEMGVLQPSAPVTWLAIDPTDPLRAYAALSGFGNDAHLWRTFNGGLFWLRAAAGLDAGAPVNTIAIEPSDGARIWLGTDRGVYKSVNGGDTWELFSNGLPRGPVYAITIDETHGRVYAATHGRGAFMLGEPSVSNYEGWVDGGIWDMPVYGTGFPPNQSTCLIQVVLRDGTICASGMVDAMGGHIQTDDNGMLITDRGASFGDHPVAWACFNGNCLGGVPITDCDRPDNPITTVVVTCGGQIGIDRVLGCPSLANPPSSLVGLSGLGGGGAAPAALGATNQRFDLSACVKTASGSSSLCTVSVPYDPSDSVEQVLERTRDAINQSLTCAAAGVTARLEDFEEGSEDEFSGDPRLHLEAPGLSGGELITALHAAPGSADGPCFSLLGLGVPVTNQLEIMRLRFETAPEGATGGQLTVMEGSTLGTCSITLNTAPGQLAESIALAFEALFQAPGVPGPNPQCPARHNPRDVIADGPSLITVLASEMTPCVSDVGVGFSLRPVELANLHPSADAGADQSVECTSAAGASVVLDGSGSRDPDSTPGTNDDIVLYEWFEDFGLPTERALGSGETLMSVLPLGLHSITLRITDGSGLHAMEGTNVSVVDTTPPVISVGMAPDSLWPPDHRMVDITAHVIATDACGAPTVVLASVTSDEADDGLGDGDTADDIQGADLGAADFAFQLRAERDGRSDGRVYTITYTASDASGNTAQGQSTVSVPHSRSRK